MNQTPTVEQFLAMQTSEDDHAEPEILSFSVDPLESIAESLSRIAASMGGETFTAELVQQEGCEHADDLAQAMRDLQDRDDWEAKHQELFLVVAGIEKIVSKSTSKVSLEVKAAIDAWRKPVVRQALTADEVAALDVVIHPEQPAHDADVEQWREYARGLGALPAEPDAIDSMNRSQIRTLLGIEQPPSS